MDRCILIFIGFKHCGNYLPRNWNTIQKVKRKMGKYKEEEEIVVVCLLKSWRQREDRMVYLHVCLFFI